MVIELMVKIQFQEKSKKDCYLLRQKVCQSISLMKTKTIYISRESIGILIHVLSWRQHQCTVFVFITEILGQTFWCNKWRSVFDVIKRLHFDPLEISLEIFSIFYVYTCGAIFDNKNVSSHKFWFIRWFAAAVKCPRSKPLCCREKLKMDTI